ncbi:hypothetical protein N0V93_007334 [Gnomoniopsis smithogilvyi]|uniref:Uncharacterized protein n=1 Tax=Gnomoniopsis smithogilvyi TaxID=1191159 RepID=A0A9W8YPV4_9PEZI|nr:hypothetical protein N0V93_007334 [Gnomoniopsis smithogilvyi]
MYILKMSPDSLNAPKWNSPMPSSGKWQHKQKHGKPVGKRELLDKSCATDGHDKHDRLEISSWWHYKQYQRCGRGFSAYMDKRGFWPQRDNAGDIAHKAVADASQDEA